MRLAYIPIVVAATVLFAGAAVAGTYSLDQQSTEASTEDVTCGQQIACQGPSVQGRATVDAPAATAEEPDPECATGQPDSRPNPKRCQTATPTLHKGTVSAYVGLAGLDDRSDQRAETQGEQAASQDGGDEGLLSTSTEAAVLLGALGLGASGAAAWFGVRRFVTFLLAPLASRLKRSELLDNDTRRAIYERIQEDPGINLRGLADELDLAWGTLLHHLRKLEDAHLVVSERYGKYRRFFLNGATYTKEEQARLAALSTPSTARVAEYILENPGSHQSEIGEAIGVTPSTVLFHVRRLKDVDLIEEERDGRYVHYYPNIQEREAQQMSVA